MKRTALLVICVLSWAIAGYAQSEPGSGAFRKGATELTVFSGGGVGLQDNTDTKFYYFGGRYGRVVTGQHGPGFLRGNMELAFDVIPFIGVIQPPRNTYGGGFTPALIKWNLTGHSKKIVPFIELGGGVIFTNRDVPVSTSNTNFTPQGGMGFHYFLKGKQSVNFTTKYMHVSNAGLSNPNPGINSSIQFILGYSWFK